jgi:ADP-heptose:LPS heptosyltransferase
MQQVLIIKPSSLGDIVHGLQVATSLKAQLDDLRISWIVRDIYAPIVRACSAVDHVYVFQRSGGAKGFLKMIREVRKTKFNYALDFQGLLRTGLMTSRVRAVTKVGRSDAREMSGMFYDEKIPLPPDGRKSHAIDILLQFCPILGAKPELRGTLKFREVDTLKLKFTEGRGGSRPIVMFPDSRKAEKRWTGFKLLTELILRGDRSRKVIWAGSGFVPDRGSFVPEQFLNLTGNTSLVSLPALL